jgi:Universal stress protein family
MKQLHFDLLAKGVLRDIHFQLLVKRGKNCNVISRILKLQSTDLIVMGTHGRTGLKKLILGSFAEGVFRQAPCQVLTVGPSIPDQAVTESPTYSVPNGWLLCLEACRAVCLSAGAEPGVQLTLLGVVNTGLPANGISGVDWSTSTIQATSWAEADNS